MANPYAISQLLQELKDIGTLPASDASSTARFLGFLNRSQTTFLQTLLLDVHEQHRVASTTVAMSGGASALIPSRAIGAKLKMLEAVTSSGAATLHPMPLENRRNAGLGGGQYHFEGNRVVLLSPVSGALRFTYYRRLGRLVLESQVGVVQSIAGLAVTLVAAPTVPTAWPTASTPYDFIQANPHFDVLGASEPATRSGNVLTFENALPAELVVGDYVALAGETPVCQAPVELHPVLIQHAVMKHYEAKKDAAAVGLAKSELADMRDMALRLLAPRADGTPEVIFNARGPGFGRRFGRRR